VRKYLGDDPLNQLCADAHLTEDGCQYFKALTDPFHDYPLKVEGFPDGRSGKSVVICAQQRMVVSKDASLPAGNWDVNITMPPVSWDNDTTVNGSYTPQGANGGRFSVSGTNPRIDGCVAWQAPSGGATFDPTAANFAIDSMNLDDYLTAATDTDLRNMRVIAQGFEVENTTASLSNQGAVVCYAISQGQYEEVVYCDDTSTYSQTSTCRTFRAPPHFLQEAAQAGGPAWRAREGALVVGTLSGPQCPVESAGSHPWLMVANNSSVPSMGSSRLGNVLVPGTTFPTGLGSHPVLMNSFNTNGAYFSGLSDDTTLEVVWKVYIELFPSVYDRAYLALATPCPLPDHGAIHLALATQRNLPPGVMRSENDSSRWFKRVKNKIKDVAHVALPIVATIATITGHPEIAAMAVAADRAINVTSKNAKQRKARQAAQAAYNAAQAPGQGSRPPSRIPQPRARAKAFGRPS